MKKSKSRKQRRTLRASPIHVAWLALNLLFIRPSTSSGSDFRPCSEVSEKGASKLLQRARPKCLPSDSNSCVLAPLSARWHQLASESKICQTIRDDHELNVTMHHVGQKRGKPALVFIHGLLADHLTWQFVAADLAEGYDIWLVDLPGCGQSDTPKPSLLEPDGYSPTALAERILQALEQTLPADERVTLIGHSLGGTVVMRMLSSPALKARYSAMLSRVDRAVLLSPCDLAVNSIPPHFMNLLELKGWKISVGQGLGVVEPKLQALTRSSYHVSGCATRERQHEFAEVITDCRRLEAAKAMLRQFVPFDLKSLRPHWREIDQLVAEYQNIRCPVLIAFGTWDETLAASTGNKLKDEIAGSLLVNIPGCGHCIPTEVPETCSELIRRFVAGANTAQLGDGLQVRVFAPGPEQDCRNDRTVCSHATAGTVLFTSQPTD